MATQPTAAAHRRREVRRRGPRVEPLDTAGRASPEATRAHPLAPGLTADAAVYLTGTTERLTVEFAGALDRPTVAGVVLACRTACPRSGAARGLVC